VKPPALEGHPQWHAIEQAAMHRLNRHGDRARWQEAVDALPDIRVDEVSFSNRVAALGAASEEERRALIGALKGLCPWRKGPFELFGVHIDTEWRSDWKWRRIATALGSLDGQQVLDVGCGNGYFGWRALSAGARGIVGVDPSVLFYMQHQAIGRYLNQLTAWPNHLLPITFEELPETPFDLVMSMGVVYHRSDPAEHVSRLYRCTRPGGRVLLESLVVETPDSLHPGDFPEARGRYARMRNVSIVPTIGRMTTWLAAAGFEEISIVDVSPTNIAEQRSTDWMTFESLAEALDPTDSSRTVEGFPAPIRAALLAHRPDIRTEV